MIQNEDNKDELAQIFDTSNKWESLAKQNEDTLLLLSGTDSLHPQTTQGSQDPPHMKLSESYFSNPSNYTFENSSVWNVEEEMNGFKLFIKNQMMSISILTNKKRDIKFAWK